MKIRGRTDPNKIALIRSLRTTPTKSKIWASLVSELSKSNRRRVVLNLSNLNRNSSPEDVVLVPGKVLGGGSLNHRLEVAAESFSAKAKEKIINAGGRCMSIEELVKRNPKGSNIRLLK